MPPSALPPGGSVAPTKPRRTGLIIAIVLGLAVVGGLVTVGVIYREPIEELITGSADKPKPKPKAKPKSKRRKRKKAPSPPGDGK